MITNVNKDGKEINVEGHIVKKDDAAIVYEIMKGTKNENSKNFNG